MPIIDGVKVACPPCIRGHRSTKCTHQAERIMVAVRKPGRPLSSCPHQKGKHCTCSNITAAIPRNAHCECGTPAPIAAPTRPVVKTEPSASVSDMAPSSPTSPTKTISFRIQKSTAMKPHSRKQSFDVSRLSQMDPNTINVIPNHGLPLGTNGSMSQTGPIPPSGYIPNIQPNYNSGAPLAPQFEYANGTTLHTFFGGTHAPIFDPPSAALSSSETFAHHSLSAIGSPHYAPTSGALSSGSRANGSCCAKSSVADKPAHEQSKTRNQSQDALDLIRYGNPLQAHDTSVPSTLEFDTAINDTATIHHTQQNNAYTFPMQYGSSIYEPLQFSQWQEMMASQSPGIASLNAYMASHSEVEPNTTVPGTYTTHQCFCGEGCQCLGCAAHPFNSTMQEYVLSAILDESSMSPKSDGDSNGITNGTTEVSPTIGPSPDTDASPAPEVESATVNDYLFVAYCPGSSQSCPCGDECECVGCMIHRDTAPKTPVTPS
ncbi:hypothetical protein GGR50DRAFT_136959 [Xylaria sp. CBS 124048]|nr:hypothetical protein GGR50DRAFT_136959 [Xylaria sp. CBS 124048]